MTIKPRKNKYKVRLVSNPVKDYSIKSNNNINSIFHTMGQSGGFESRNLSNSVEILQSMQKEVQCTKFLSFVGALISTGVRGIIRDMIKSKMFDCIITTCGALDHDIARTYDNYYAGEFRMNDYSLFKKNIHRLGNVLIPMNNYGPLIEDKVQACLKDLYYKHGKRDIATYEIVDYIGSTLDESSFLYWAHKNKIPIIVPGIVDGAVGSQIWFFHQQHKDFKIDILMDETKLSDLIYEAKKSAAFMVGGGISKHHTLWWNQFRGGLDYAVYITTASEWDGSLSGAPVEEAISWSKVTTKARHATIHGEATVLLPFIYAALIEHRN
ncbi:MAG: deoxyhypusine synthase [Nitrososphaeraceae archaeon]|nr:deoxyhypusine synthase [Nitrososphaeraceae archaeon]